MRRNSRATFWILAVAWLGCAQAQIVPRVQVPDVNLPGLPTDPAVRGVGETLRELPSRAVRSQQLLRRHRAELDRDPRGELVVRAEVVGIDVTSPALERARAADFIVLRELELAELDVRITVLRTPPGVSATRGLKRLRKLDPGGTYDYNHVYLDSAVPAPAPGAVAPAPPPAGANNLGRVRIGLIDGGVDATHAALAGDVVHRSGCGGVFVPNAHGLAVASVMARGGLDLELYAADVYCGSPAGGAVDAVAGAFGWLAREQIAVINVSLVGPRNALLERVVRTLVARGHVIVAAVGNDGPASPPLYPAAYDGVVGVTAVDGRHRALLEACRGRHVDFAALGADVEAAGSPPDGWARVRGTSFAAPVIAVLFARGMAAPDPDRVPTLIAEMTASAVDLGNAGRDDVYGAGELAFASSASATK